MKYENAPWLRFYNYIQKHLEYPDLSLYQMIKLAAEKNPDCSAYDFMDVKTSFASFHDKILNTAAAFLRLGISRGDRVIVALPNIPQILWCLYALNRIGAIPDMIHPMSASEELSFYIKTSHCRAVVATENLFDNVLRNADIPEISVIIVRNSDVSESVCNVWDERIKPAVFGEKNTINWNDFYFSGFDGTLPDDMESGSDIGVILYTGATTGRAKAVSLTNSNINAAAMQIQAGSGCTFMPGMKMLSIMPVFHAFGLTVGIHSALIYGMECILVARFSREELERRIKTDHPDIIAGVPTVFEALTHAQGLEKTRLSFLKGVFSGGDAMPVDLKKRVDAFLESHGAHVCVREGYGTTECAAAGCLTPRDMYKEGSVGIPLPDVYFKITEKGSTKSLGPNEEGEICLRGLSVMRGYMDDPIQTGKALRRHEDGHVWLHTGDIGFMDSDGFVYFVQRMDRMIITSGYNVYPSQIEHILNTHEKVKTSCVIGVPDKYKMQKLKAYLVPAKGVKGTDELKEELKTWLRKKIANYALPYDIEFRSALPLTAAGKIAYRVLEEEEKSRIDQTMLD